MTHIRNPETAYLGLGSNLGDRLAAMRAAVAALAEHPRIDVDFQIGIASLFETRAVGGPAGQPDYLNTAVRIETSLAPRDLLEALMAIEARLGRVRRKRWEQRVIDIDLLLFDELVVDDVTLSVPHPRMHERRFVLEPLAEIAGDVTHPILGETVTALLRRLRSAGCTGEVNRVRDRDWFSGSHPLPALVATDQGLIVRALPARY